MQVSQVHIVSPSGKKLAVNGKKLMFRHSTYTVTVVNNSHWASISQMSYVVLSGTDLSIPVIWLDGSDSTCISASNATVTPSGIVVTSVSADMTITVTDAKYRVTAALSDTVAVSSVTPDYQFVLPSATASFTLTYNTGYSASDLVIDAGTISGNTLSVTASTVDTDVHISTIADYIVSVQNNAPYVSVASSFPTRPGGTVVIPVTYLDGSDDSCLSVTGGTLDNGTITVSNVRSNITVYVNPVKVQVKASTISPAVIDSVSPGIQYVLPNTSATVSITYAPGYDQTNVRVNVGSVSGNTWTIPTSTSSYAVNATISDAVARYTYFKLDITKLRSNSDNIFQLSEWELYDQNDTKVNVTYVAGTAGTSSSEYPSNMFDGNTSTKWCVRSSSCYVICMTSVPIGLSRYRFATANDTATFKRNPVSWTISASAVPVTTRDSSLWEVIDRHVDDTSIPVQNLTYVSFNVPSG